MAEVAHGTTCACGTFNAIGGRKSDATLMGQCGGCGRSISMPNPSYTQTDADKDAQIAALQAQLDKPELPPDGPPPVVEGAPEAPETVVEPPVDTPVETVQNEDDGA